jgi:hypothetical protein
VVRTRETWRHLHIRLQHSAQHGQRCTATGLAGDLARADLRTRCSRVRVHPGAGAGGLSEVVVVVLEDDATLDALERPADDLLPAAAIRSR